MIQKYGISASTLKRVVKNSLVPLKTNVGQSFQTYSEWCNSDIIMDSIGWFLESTKHPFTWHDIQKYIMDKLEIEMKPHIIRRLLRDKFNKRYKKGSSRPTKLDFKKHSWTNAFFCVKLLSILHSLKMIINVDGCCFSRSTKQNYSWLDKGLSCWLQNIKYTGSISLLSAISSNGTHLSAVYSWTIDAKIFVQFLDSLFQYMDKKEDKVWSTSLIIMDNWPYQKSKLVKEKLKAWDINWIYLPPYSPELAPIELLFRSLKAKLRRCRDKEMIWLSSQTGIDTIIKATREIRPKEIIKYWVQFFNEIKSIIEFIYRNK